MREPELVHHQFACFSVNCHLCYEGRVGIGGRGTNTSALVIAMNTFGRGIRASSDQGAKTSLGKLHGVLKGQGYARGMLIVDNLIGSLQAFVKHMPTLGWDFYQPVC